MKKVEERGKKDPNRNKVGIFENQIAGFKNAEAMIYAEEKGGFLKCEMPSAGMCASARGLAKLASVLSKGGGDLMSPETFASFQGNPTLK